MTSEKHRAKLLIGILISLFFMVLAFRKVDFGQMLASLKKTDYLFLVYAVLVVFLSHYLRAFRWRYLLDPIRRLDMKSLFSSLIMGYAANVLTPAHLGELLRAYALSKKRHLSTSATLATVIMERIMDVFSLLALMVLTVFVHPFPAWVIKSGYLFFAGTVGLSFFLILLKVSPPFARACVLVIQKISPKRFAPTMEMIAERFLSGILPLKRWHDYITVTFLSMAIWACYGLVFYFSLHAFGFMDEFRLPWQASLILLVITSVAVVVPSSPGYIGPYHYLCQVSLAMFDIPAGPALSYATVVHAVSFLPVFFVGLAFANYEGMSLYGNSMKKRE